MTYTIRHAEPQDAAAIYTIMNQPSVVAGTLQEPHSPTSRFAEQGVLLPNGGRRFVALNDVGEVVGVATMGVVARPRRRHVGNLGMSVHEAWQGKGVGSVLMQAIVDQADKWLNLTRLELEVYTDNAAAIALYQKFGFEIEGTLRKWAFRNGELVDAHVMGRVR